MQNTETQFAEILVKLEEMREKINEIEKLLPSYIQQQEEE